MLVAINSNTATTSNITSTHVISPIASAVLALLALQRWLDLAERVDPRLILPFPTTSAHNYANKYTTDGCRVKRE